MADLLRPLLVSRLLLSALVPHDTLILCAGRGQRRLWHTFLPAMLATLILHTFQVIFLGHRDLISSGSDISQRLTRFYTAGSLKDVHQNPLAQIMSGRAWRSFGIATQQSDGLCGEATAAQNTAGNKYYYGKTIVPFFRVNDQPIPKLGCCLAWLGGDSP